jgi:RNA polymerase sigma-70 factor (ECF subfamily)
MKRRGRRSTDVSTAVATATDAPPAGGKSARAAFEALYRESRDDVFAYVAGLLRDRSAAEEVTSAAFEKAWRKRRQIDPERGSARTWLFGIARNTALDELRRLSRRADLPDDGSAEPGAPFGPPVGPSGGDPAEVAIRRTALRQAMATLSGRERELIALKFFAGLSNSEIAEVIGASESNAGTRIHRVVEKLRRSFDEAA